MGYLKAWKPEKELIYYQNKRSNAVKKNRFEIKKYIFIAFANNSIWQLNKRIADRE